MKSIVLCMCLGKYNDIYFQMKITYLIQFKVMVNGITSEEYIQYEGVPQGSVLSTTLFILAIDNILYTLPREVQCSLSVDDFAIWLSYFNEKGQTVLQEAVDSIISWTSHGFTISRSKTVATTFTRKYRTVKPSLLLYGQPIKYVNHTKFLGLHFDEKMTWKYHFESVREKCGKVLCLLKRLSHTRWGADRSTLLYLHQTLVLSKIDYGSHLYASGSKSLLKKLDSLHHNGLRIATGAFRSFPVIFVTCGDRILFLKSEKRRIWAKLLFWAFEI